MNTEQSSTLSNFNFIGESNMTNSVIDTPVAPATSAGFDLNALRLPANYSTGYAVKRVLNRVPVSKPEPSKFFRVREGEEWTLDAFIYIDKDANETYIVHPAVQPCLGNLARPVKIYTAIDRNNNPFLIPVVLPGEDGKWNSWHQSLSGAVSAAMENWVRMAFNKSINAYDINMAIGPIPDPEWPEASIEELIKVAFEGKIINQPNHPVIRALEGAV